MELRQVNIYDLIDGRRIGIRQCFIDAFCAFLMPFDGFDTKIISFVAPVLAKEWHLSKPDTGSIFSACLFGLLIDDFCIPFLTQRFATKRSAFVATGLFGLFTGLNVFTTSVPQLPS